MPPFDAPTRRAFAFVSGVAFVSLAAHAARARAVQGAAKEHLASVVARVDALAAALKAGEIAATEWQDAMAVLTAEARPEEFAAAIDFDRLIAQTAPAARGVATAKVILPRVDPTSRIVGAKLFVLGKARAIIPHGHIGMASGHLVLAGALRRRQYERVAMEPDAWILRQTIDEADRVGSFSTISDDRDNIHWLIAEDLSATLDFIVAPSREDGAWTVQNLDMDASRRSGDLLHAPTIGVEAALAKYG